MSFKLVGDQYDLIKQGTKHRIANLLTENVRDSEYKQLSNGKLACLICPNAPVFDTPAMLSVHRAGKKHIANFENSSRRERSDMQAIEKIIQERKLEAERKAEKRGFVGPINSPLIEATRLTAQRALSGTSHAQKTNATTGPAAAGFFQQAHTSKSSSYQERTTADQKRKREDDAIVKVKPTPDYVYPWRAPVDPGARKRLKSDKNIQNGTQAISAEEKERGEKNAKMVQKGYKWDHRENQWVQDPDAEFESDEEDSESTDAKTEEN
eukprot:Colp12_sorted_trinity150504_noHs@5629